MSENKKKTALALAIFATFWFVVGGVCGFFMAKGMYDQPIVESVTRDTVTLHDTIIQYWYAPTPLPARTTSPITTPHLLKFPSQASTTTVRTTMPMSAASM